MKQKLFNQKGILSLFYSICFLLIGANLSWGQNVATSMTTSGTWTCPAGVTSVQVEAWGGGGGGAGASSSTNLYTGGGGAGGNYARNTSVTVVPGTVYTVTVGAGGAAGGNTGTALNATTSNGGTSSFGTLLFASGGVGGAGGLTATKQGIGGGNAGIYGYTITSGGTAYSSVPVVTIGTAWAASQTYTLNQQVSHLGKLYTVTIAGTSGTTAPTHAIGTVAANGGTASFLCAGYAATAVAGTSGTGSTKIVNALTVVNPGSGYLTAPTVNFSGGGTPSAVATATALVNSAAIDVTGATTYALGGFGGNGTYTALSTSNAAGGGGASGGPLGLGNNGSGVNGGIAVTGNGGGANAGSASATPGNAATEVGGGGSGGVGASKTGGAGAAGKVVITILDKTAPANPGVLTIPTIAATSLKLDWVASADDANADFTGYLLVRYATAPAADNDPVQNVTYTSGSTFNTGATPLLGTVVSVGTTKTFTNTGLTENTTYYYKVYAFDSNRNYSDESSASGTPVTPAEADTTPPLPAGAASVANQTGSSLTLNWVASTSTTDLAGYLVVRYTGAPEADSNPANGTEYDLVTNKTIATGTPPVTDPVTAPKTGTVVYVGSALTLNQTGLTSDKNYYYRIFTYDIVFNYSAASTVTGRTSTQLVAPIATAADTPVAGGFTANWGAVTNATGYTASVYTSTNAVSTIVGWTIPNQLADATSITADAFSTNNSSKTLTQNNGTILTTGQSGNPVTGFAARGASYNSTTGTAPNQVVLTAPVKYWQIEVNTVGFKNATISSDHISSASGPRDFKLQYSSTGTAGTFEDLVSTITLNSSSWTSLTNVALPAACQNNPNVVLRWAQTSFMNVANPSLEMTTAGGTNKIDNILVKGEKLDLVNTVNVVGNTTPTTASTAITGLTGGYYYYDVFATGTNSTNGSGVLSTYLSSPKSNVISYLLIIAEANADFKSIASGNMSDPAIWQYYDGTAWNNATVAPTSTNNVTITAGHVIALTANFAVDASKTMTVNGTINLAGYKVTGSGAFALGSGATIKLGENTSLATGITATSTFSTAANYFYDGTVAQNTASLPTASITGNVTISNNSAGVVLAAALRINTPGTLFVTGKLMMGDGNVVDGAIIGSGTFNYNGSGHFSAAAGSTLGITSSKGICKLADNTGNIRNSGTRTFANGINYIFAKNDNANAINMGTSFGNEISATLGINNLTINNPLGVYLPGAIQAVNAGLVTVTDFVPDTDITVNGVLNFVSGKLVANNGVNLTTTVDGISTYSTVPQSTGTKTVTIVASGSITGASASTGWVIGNLKKLTDSGANPSFTYTIGDANYYTPLTVTFSGNTTATGGLTARTTAEDHVQIATSDINATKSINRNWTLTNDSLAGFTNYNATFTYATQDNDSSVVTQFFAARLYDGASWSNLTTSGTPSSTSFTASSISSFGDFAIGQVCTNPTAGGTISGTQSLCVSGNPTDLLSATAATGFVGVLEYKWQSSTDNSTFSDITDATASSYSPPAGLSVTTYYKRLARVDCKSDWSGAASSNVITVTVNTVVTPTFTQVAAICLGTTLSALPTTSNNSITGTWAPSLNNTATTLYTFTPTEGSCADTATMTITVNKSVAGIISGNQTITTATTPTNITLSNYTGSIQWQSSTNGTTFTNISGATSPTLSGATIGELTVNTYIRAVVTNGSCNPVNSDTSTITITCCKYKFISN
jgi:hypothetical protein